MKLFITDYDGTLFVNEKDVLVVNLYTSTFYTYYGSKTLYITKYSDKSDPT